MSYRSLDLPIARKTRGGAPNDSVDDPAYMPGNEEDPERAWGIALWNMWKEPSAPDAVAEREVDWRESVHGASGPAPGGIVAKMEPGGGATRVSFC